MTDEDRCYYTAQWGGGERVRDQSLYVEIEAFVRKYAGAKIIAHKGYWADEAAARRGLAGAAVHRFVSERYDVRDLLSVSTVGSA